MSRLLPFFTIQTFNQNSLQPAGAVFAQRVESISIGRSIFAGADGSVGGRSVMMEKKMNDLTRALMEELDIQAKKTYPNAVALVNVQFHFSDIGKNDSNMFLAGQASATALIKRVKAVGQSMAPSEQLPLAMAPAMPPAMPPAMAPAMPPAMSQPMVSPGASAPLSPIPVEQVNTKLMGIPRAISGGKSKRKSFISKSRTIKANRKHK